MAANSSSRGITTLGKRVINRIWTSNSPYPTHSSPLAPRRAAYSSVYDKNPDDQIQSGVLPDDVIQEAAPSGKYWAPHPQTGVFGPPAEPSSAGVDRELHSGDPAAGSVLEEKAWFRPTSLEDTEKPHTLA